MPHELRGIERVLPSWYGYLFLAVVLIAAVLALFVRYLSHKHKAKRTSADQIKMSAKKRRARPRKRK